LLLIINKKKRNLQKNYQVEDKAIYRITFYPAAIKHYIYTKNCEGLRDLTF